MATIRQIRKRIERAEQSKYPTHMTPPFQVRDGTQTPEELEVMERELEEYERRHPNGPPGLIIHCERYTRDD
jgi:hypothetical protein